jgi:hypothetical protein
MDDKNPNHDQTPQTPESTPDAQTVPVTPTTDPTAAAPAADQPAASPAAAPVDAAPKAGRKRGLLIGGGIVAALLLAGGGVAVGAAIADEFGDDDDDRPSMADGPRHHDGERGERGEDRGDRGEGQRPPAEGRGPVGTDSADELVDIAAAAQEAAEGEVTSIDAKRGGFWVVQLTTSAGDETEVRVDADLATTVGSTEAAEGDDTAPSVSLDEDAIRALVAAALDEAEGLITDLDVDSDEVSPYDVSVLTRGNQSVDIDFDAQFAVVGTETDD